jgi:shikimate kinase
MSCAPRAVKAENRVEVRRHILLIGLPGAGKTTVGALVAAALGTGFVDLDDMIEREQGLSVGEIFSQRGESGFRKFEREAAGRVFGGNPIVVSPGGGWAAQPGAVDEARRACFIVYLRTEPDEAARRVGHGRSRPLLGGADPAVRMRELFAAREAFYLRAHATVRTDARSVEEVTQDVVLLARSQAGW